MAYGKRPTFSSLPESPPDSHGGGGDGITGGRAAGFGYGEVRGDAIDLSGLFTGFDPYPPLPGYGFCFEEEKSADCHAGCVSKEKHERLSRCLREIEVVMSRFRDSWMHFLPCTSADRSPLSSHRGRKSGGGRELADRFQGDGYSRFGMGKGGVRSYGDGDDDLGSSSQPFRGEAAARDSPKLRPREGDWCCSCGYPNFARRLHCRDCGGPRPEHMPGSREGCSFPYAYASSYAGPSADCRAPPVPPSRAPRAPDIRKRSRSPTWGALPPKEYGGDPKMKRGRDDGHGPV